MPAPFILLINPWIYDFAAYDLWIKPIGLLSIAGLFKKNGFGIHVIDCLDPVHPAIFENRKHTLPSRKETGCGHFFKEEIAKPVVLKEILRKYRRYGILPSVFEAELNSIPRPQAVLVTSMMTYWYPGVFHVIKMVRSLFHDVPILLGGVYATVCPEHARHNSGADYIISGPCDLNFSKIINHIFGQSINFFEPNIFLQADCNLLSSKKSIPILSSKGCPLKCPYCASSLLYPDFIQREPQKVVAEIEYWVAKEGTTDFVFYDDALLINAEEHIIIILEEVLKRGISCRFHVPNGLHVRNITEAIAELMLKTGFQTIRLGLESSDPHLQNKTGNKVTKKEFIRAAAALKKAGFSEKEVGVYVLAGLPGQEFQSAYDTVRFVQDQGLRPYVAEYSPIPGTSLWQEAVQWSRFPIAEEPLFHNNTLLPCQWEKFTLDDLNFLKTESRKSITRPIPHFPEFLNLPNS